MRVVAIVVVGVSLAMVWCDQKCFRSGLPDVTLICLLPPHSQFALINWQNGTLSIPKNKSFYQSVLC